MSGPHHPTGHARVNSQAPEAHGICQRCGFRYLRKDLVQQFEWAGVKLQNLEIYVCTRTCLDQPQIQLRTIILPPDPVPVYKPFPEQYDAEEPSPISTTDAFSGPALGTENPDEQIGWSIEDTPIPDPNNPVLYPP